MRKHIISLALWLSVAGCAQLPTFQPSGEQQASQDASRICQSLVTHTSTAHSARALVHATVRSGRESASFRYAVVMKESRKMRIDLLPLEGAYTLGLLVVTPDGGTLIDTTNKTFSTERDAEKLTREFVGLPGLSPEVVLALLTGRLPLLSCSSPQVFKTREGTVMLREDSSRIVWDINQDSETIRGAQILDAAGEKIEAVALVEVGEGGLPLVRFSVFSPTSASAEMTVQRLTLNKDIPEDLFRVAAPADYTLR